MVSFVHGQNPTVTGVKCVVYTSNKKLASNHSFKYDVILENFNFCDSDIVQFEIRTTNQFFDLVDRTFFVGIPYYRKHYLKNNKVKLLTVMSMDSSLPSVHGIDFKSLVETRKIINDLSVTQIKDFGYFISDSIIVKSYTANYVKNVTLDLDPYYKILEMREVRRVLGSEKNDFIKKIRIQKFNQDILRREMESFAMSNAQLILSNFSIKDSVDLRDTLLNLFKDYIGFRDKGLEIESELKVLNLKLADCNAKVKNLDLQISGLEKSSPNFMSLITQNGSDCGFASIKKSNGRFARVSYFVYDPNKHTFFIEEKSNFSSTLQSCYNKGRNPLFVTNGGMFHRDYASVGLLVIDGMLKSSINTTNPQNGENFFLMPNGVLYIGSKGLGHVLQTKDFGRNTKSDSMILYATQSGPMLVYNDTINSTFKMKSDNEKIRSGVGGLPDGKLLFFVSDDPMNFFDFALLFQRGFGCKNALFLDGAISDSYINTGKRSNYSNYRYGCTISICTK
jgi:uncharacterized protein YigE (DUF2233 family)